MRSWEIVDHEPVPDDDGTIYLMNRGSEYMIHVNGYELMGNNLHGSEDALADLACDRLLELVDARVLVGGLGMGFTLAQALRRIGTGGEAVVAELMPAVVRWNRELVGLASGHPLRDRRAHVHLGDVADLIDGADKRWSAILLDIDNGPEALTRPTNGWLYTRQGLLAARSALIPGGVLGIWSANNSRQLTHLLSETDFETEVLPHTEDGRSTDDDTGTHILWMARRPLES